MDTRAKVKDVIVKLLKAKPFTAESCIYNSVHVDF